MRITANTWEKVSRLGFDVLEIAAGALPDMTREQRQNLAQMARDAGIELTFCIGLPAQYDMASEDPAVRQAGMQYAKKLLECVHEMGGKVLGGILYSSWPARMDFGLLDKRPWWDRSVQCVQKVAQIANDYGIHYCLEIVNRYEQFLINTVDEGPTLSERCGQSACKLLLDVFHMNIEEDSIAQAIETAGDAIGHFHIGETNRRVPGRGRMPWGRNCRRAGTRRIYRPHRYGAFPAHGRHCGVRTSKSGAICPAQRTKPGWIGKRIRSALYAGQTITERMTGYEKNQVGLLTMSDGRIYLHEEAYEANMRHQNAIQKALEDSGKYEVIAGSGPINSNDMARHEAERLRRENVEVTLINFTIWCYPQYTAVATSIAPGPYLLLSNLHPSECGMVGMLAAAGTLEQLGRPFGKLWGAIEDPAVFQRVDSFLRAAAAINRLRGQTFGNFGGRPLGHVHRRCQPGTVAAHVWPGRGKHRAGRYHPRRRQGRFRQSRTRARVVGKRTRARLLTIGVGPYAGQAAHANPLVLRPALHHRGA